MPLYDADRQPHFVNIYKPILSKDDGGGNKVTWTLVQANMPCRINPHGPLVPSTFDQTQWVQPTTVSFLTADLAAPIERGWKLKAADTNAEMLVTGGVGSGRSAHDVYSNIPPLCYFHAEEWL